WRLKNMLAVLWKLGRSRIQSLLPRRQTECAVRHSAVTAQYQRSLAGRVLLIQKITNLYKKALFY
ncbi:hypothetical protein, partial [Pseudomonas fluorescens]